MASPRSTLTGPVLTTAREELGLGWGSGGGTTIPSTLVGGSLGRGQQT